MNNIRAAREAAGLTQKQVALSLGVSSPTVSDWENGKKFPIGKNMLELSKLFACTTDYLLGKTNEPYPIASAGAQSDDIDVNSLRFALYGEVKDLDDELVEELLRNAKRMKELIKLREQNSK